MMHSDNRFDSAIAGVYNGSLEDFVKRRDALVKELRAAKDAESATKVKALRKPSRLAWALNLAVLESDQAIGSLIDAVGKVVDAHSAGGDARSAITELRAVVRDFGSDAAHVAERAGHRIEPNALANAVLAVIGEPQSFDELRRGCLVDIPEGGGLDVLAVVTTSPEPARQAASILTDAQNRARAAEQAVRNAEAKLHAAEEDVRIARSEYDRARREADAAAAQLTQLGAH